MTASRKYAPPDSKEELDDLAERLLDASGCRDILPTPLEQIAAVKNLELVTEDDSVINYMKRLTKEAKKISSQPQKSSVARQICVTALYLYLQTQTEPQLE